MTEIVIKTTSDVKIYARLDSSNLYELIGPDDEVFYSAGFRASNGAGKYALYWNTHVILSKSGIYLTEFLKKKKSVNRYIPWDKLVAISKNGFTVKGAKKFSVVNLSLIRYKEDTKLYFKNLQEEFLMLSLPYIINACKIYLEYLRSNKDNDEIYKSRRENKIMKRIIKLEKKNQKLINYLLHN